MEENKKEEKEMEQWNDVKEKKGSGVIIVLLLLIIAGLGLFIYFNKDKLFGEKETKPEENEIQEVDDEEEIDDSTEIKELDLSKSLNTTGYTYDSLTDKDEDVGFSLKINEDKKSVTVTIDEKGSKLISNATTSTWSTEPYDEQISGFNKNIKSTFISGIGQSAESTIFFFIMEDGTLQYVKLFERKSNDDGTTYYSKDMTTIQEVPDVEGIVKLYGSNSFAPQSTGYYTTLAAKADGSFYDLSQIIK